MTRLMSRLQGLLPILLLALALRLFGIATESLWVDEAFTADTARGSVAQILEANARDTHPPAYYLGVSLWRQLAFEIAPDLAKDPTAIAIVLRSYSVVWSLLGVFLLMKLAAAMAGERAALFAGLFAACNPLDIYFADEARMYSQATAISIGGALALWHWCASVREGGARVTWWPAAAWFALCGTALLYTHYVGVTLLVAQGLLGLIVFVRARAWQSVMGLFVAAIAVAATFAPWLAYVFSFRDSLANDVGLDWMPIPQFVDYVSFVGREFFWGRANQFHSEWWIPTALLPLSVMGAAVCVRFRDSRPHDRAVVLHLFASIALPLLLCAAASASYQVIYYRPRYSVFLLPYFLVGLAFACQSLRSKRSTHLAVAALTLAMVVGTVVQEQTPQKRPWRETAQSWPTAAAPAFYVVLPPQHQRPLGHYLDGSIRHTPKSVLERLGPLPSGALIWVASWPDTLAPKDRTYQEWLKRVGPARRQTLPSFYTLTQVEPAGVERWPDFARERFRAWYRPFDIREEVSGFSNARQFDALGFNEAGEAIRQSRGTPHLRFDQLAGGELLVLCARPPTGQAAARVWAIRAETPADLFNRGSSIAFDPEAQEFRVPVPDGNGPVWLGWRQDPDSTASLTVRWVGVASGSASAMAMQQ